MPKYSELQDSDKAAFVKEEFFSIYEKFMLIATPKEKLTTVSEQEAQTIAKTEFAHLIEKPEFAKVIEVIPNFLRPGCTCGQCPDLNKFGFRIPKDLTPLVGLSRERLQNYSW